MRAKCARSGPAARGARQVVAGGLLGAVAALPLRPAWAQDQAGGAQPLATSAPPATTQPLGPSQPFNGSLLPSLGTDPRIDNLRTQIERYFNPGPSPVGQPKWLIEPSLGVETGLTDNALQIHSPRRADLYTMLSPTISISGDTARLKANVTYSPSAQLYASNGSQNRFDQTGAGSLLGIIVPDMLFLDVRGTVTQTSRTAGGSYGGFGPGNVDDQVQTASFSVSPYLVHRFGGWGSARLGYSFARTMQDDVGDQGVFTNPFYNPYGTNPYGTTGNLSTHHESLTFVTGENLGRFNIATTAEAFQYSGSGAYRDAHRNQVDVQVAYALTRRITLLGGGGYQDIAYGGYPPIRVREPSYDVGARYTLGEENSITVLWGRRDGIGSVAVDAIAAPTARTRLLARYTTGITSDLEQMQSLLQVATPGPGGTLLDAATAAPVALMGANGLQNGIYKLRRLSVTGMLLRERDTVSVSFSMDDQTTLSNTVSVLNGITIPAGSNSTGYTGVASWQHELSPVMSSTLSASYGVSDSNSRFLFDQGDRQNTLVVSAAITRQLTETLSGSLRYIHTDRTGGQNATLGGRYGGDYSENLFLVGLRKRF